MISRLLLPSVLFIFIFITSCSEEELLNIEVFDFNETITSKPANNYVIGTVNVNSNQSGLSYSLTSESNAGALAIDPNSGELTVNDASVFDISVNSRITAEVEVTNGDITKMADIVINLDLSTFKYEVISYFKDVALGFEFGGASQETRRWETDINIFVGGNPSSDLLTELDNIIFEINGLVTSGITVRKVSDQQSSNYYLHIGTGQSYANIYPFVGDFIDSNWGLFFINWVNEYQLNSGHMYVDNVRAEVPAQKHLLREELTQSMGLARDSDLYEQSIFQSSWTTTNSYAVIDRELIRLLYHPDMQLGKGAVEVEQILIDILKSEW